MNKSNKQRNRNNRKEKIDKTKQNTDERQEAFKSLPPHIKNNLTEEEKELFLHAEEWPESMFKKLEEFIIPQ